MSKYAIIYDFDDECGETYKNCREEFVGSWVELQAEIKQMRNAGCYNIDANCMEE